MHTGYQESMSLSHIISGNQSCSSMKGRSAPVYKCLLVRPCQQDSSSPRTYQVSTCFQAFHLPGPPSTTMAASPVQPWPLRSQHIRKSQRVFADPCQVGSPPPGLHRSSFIRLLTLVFLV